MIHSDRAFHFATPALNAATMSRVMSRCGPEFAGALVRQIDVLRHKAGRRCLIRYEVQAADGSVSQILGKVRVKGADVATFRNSRELRRCGFADSVRVPEPLGVVPEFRMWLQRREPGRCGAESLRGHDVFAAARRIAHGLRRLHASSYVCGPIHTVDREIDILDRRLTAVEAARPEWGRRLGRIRSLCRQLADRLRRPAQSLIHRDFYPEQVLVAPDAVVLLDLDLLSRGDPALDVGNFIAHLLESAIRMPGSAARLRCSAAEFRTEYLGDGCAVSPEAIDAYTTLSLARLFAIAFEFPDRLPFAAATLNLVESRLACVESDCEKSLECGA
ncbi:MAG: aminoglycoside phosphotransferase family protein [Gemmataceae bacterium]|nr:aminoglycoside phosphotransferase family protein [Gemmataceae bacterium]